MTESSLFFELPENLTAKKFLSQLGKKIDFDLAYQQYTIKTFYDTFDWRLYRAGFICEFNHSKDRSVLSLIDRNQEGIVAEQEMLDVPKFHQQLTGSTLQRQIAPIIEMRALLPLSQLPLDVFGINLLNKEQKTIMRVKVEAYESLTNRLQLLPLKGYDKYVDKMNQLLQEDFMVQATSCSALKSALKLQKRKPNDYSSKITLKLKADTPAHKASKQIYWHLYQAMKLNEAGTIADIDSEYLHDFRVAVRRTRSALSQFKKVLDSGETAEFAEFFAWLGQITGPTRDLDVYLLSFENYQSALPALLEQDLKPLYHFLKQKQKTAQAELAKKLQTSKYQKQMLAWEALLKDEDEGLNASSDTHISIKLLADQRIWKVYQQILKEGNAIDNDSEAVALHDLRKTCKKLRYLMEFFQSLYPKYQVLQLIKALKNFQNVLGDFQDYEVQADSIKRFSEEMIEHDVGVNTILAMGVLIQHLDDQKCKARNDFDRQFNVFKQTENSQTFKALFKQ